jgi:hypothetical protein
MSLQHTCQKLHGRHIFVYFLLRSWTFCLTIWITSTRCMVLKASSLIVVVGTKTTPVTIAARRLPGQKYLLYSALMIISHSSFSRLWFLSPALDSLAMEDKRGTKCPNFPSAEGCPFTQRCQDSTIGDVWVSTTTRVPIGDHFMPPSLTGD